MLREYQRGDELLLNCNQFSVALDVQECIDGRGFKARTFQKEKSILCIFLYLQYVKDHYAVFSLVSRDITFNELRELKKEVAIAAKEGGAKTFLTFCNKSGKLDRWHKFMGFTKCRNALAGRAKDVARWIKKWD